MLDVPFPPYPHPRPRTGVSSATRPRLTRCFGRALSALRHPSPGCVHSLLPGNARWLVWMCRRLGASLVPPWQLIPSPCGTLPAFPLCRTS